MKSQHKKVVVSECEHCSGGLLAPKSPGPGFVRPHAACFRPTTRGGEADIALTVAMSASDPKRRLLRNVDSNRIERRSAKLMCKHDVRLARLRVCLSAAGLRP